MATSSNQLTAPSCSSSSSPSSSTTCWDVFLSFYGEDTRKNFTSHLYSALDRAGILTFMDDPELKKGEEISRGLLNAIHGSKLLIVVLSKNYAFSRWCLDELVEILTSKRTSGHVVIPVFYYVDPSDLRRLKGSFRDALDVQKERYSVETVEKWASALAEIAGLSGYHLKTDANYKNESDTIQEIVENVTPLISTKDLLLEEYLVGIDSSVEDIYKILRMESNDVRAIGICGMGGIGKTTVAKAFYNEYFKNFDISCFVDDVKQHSQGGDYLLPLLQQLSVKLFGRTGYNKATDVKSGIKQLKQFLFNKKALIVMDGLDRSSYSKLLVRVCNLVFAGSRIIFTTRDANLAKQLKEDISEVDIYMMRELEQVDSLELFSYHAFRKPTPPECFKELSVRFITYAGGLPLALKVLGSSLLGRTDVSFWKDKLLKVEDIGENDIQQILRLSYDELGDETLKAIFLDIAFFFIGKDKDEAVHIFKSCGFFPDVGIPVLVERCLLTITQNNILRMHSLIQDMGKEVIREESEHGNCRRLYLGQGNTCMALQQLQGTQKLEGLIIDQARSPKIHLGAKILEKLPKLRLLKIIGAHEIKGNFENSFHELRCICWRFCPWTRLPSSFRPQKLVSLDMPCSKLKTLWKGVMPSVNLKTINLSYSRNLKIMPDFSNVTLVEKLSLHGCTSLLKVHPSIGQMTNLSDLDLGECDHLRELPELIGQLTKLGHLELGGCVRLKRLPDAITQLTNLGSLNLDDCRSLTRLPEQLGDMKCLKNIDASWTSIEKVPDSIVYLKELVGLQLHGCRKLRKLPEQLGDMKCLKMLDASRTSIEQLPDSIGYLKELVELKLFECKKLRKLPEQIGNMESLKLFEARDSAIEHLPDTFGGLTNLEELHLSYCKNLTSLPNTLWKLKALRVLNLDSSSKLEQLPEQLGKMQCLESLSACGTSVEELPESIGLLSTLQVLKLGSCKKIRKLPSSIWNLTSLAELFLLQEVKINLPDMVKDTKLKSLEMTCDVSLWLPVILSLSSLENLYLHCESQSFSPNEPYSLSKLSNLRRLILYNKIRHECSFPELPLNLTKLSIWNYETLEMLPDLSSLKQLKNLSLWRCISLQSIPPLPPQLEELYLCECTSLQDLPDLSMLKELRRLKLRYCINLKSIPLLPPHLEKLDLEECTSLQDLPDLSILKELRNLDLRECINLKSNSLKQSFLQVEQNKLNLFEAQIRNKEVAEWFSYNSSGNTLSFTIPPTSGDGVFSFGLWYSYTCKFIDGRVPNLRVVITNRTKDIKMDYPINLMHDTEVVECITREWRSGDRIKVSISSGEVKVKNCGARLIWRKQC